jgi:hypothetical protein
MHHLRDSLTDWTIIQLLEWQLECDPSAPLPVATPSVPLQSTSSSAAASPAPAPPTTVDTSRLSFAVEDDSDEE